MSTTMRIALAAGDGIGPEIMDATIALFRAAGVGAYLEFVPVEMGKAVFDKGDSRGMTDAAQRTVEECGILFKGPMETPKGGGGKSINVTARKIWNAFANFRTFRTLPGVDTIFSRAGVPIDLVIVRENVEDTYGGVEHRLTNDVIQGKRITSAPGCDQVLRFSFETARKLGLKRIDCGHKANIMKLTDGLWLERFRSIAKEYPDIASGDVIVDALCMNLVLKPESFQMVVLPNLQGDIVSDLCAGLVGGLGFAPSSNIGTHISIFEAVHGTAPDIAGKGIANPSALILSGLMMLRHLGLGHLAATIENAFLRALEDGVRTGDFGDRSKPALATTAFANSIADRLGQQPQSVPPAVVTDVPDALRVRPPARPTRPVVVRTFTNVKAQVVGCDIYLDSQRPLHEVAEELTRLASTTPFRLTLLSNRGTQVWPTGSAYTECVDYWRARFELPAGAAHGAVDQAQALDLLQRVSATHVVSAWELLRTFDGAKGYSMAQGQ